MTIRKIYFGRERLKNYHKLSSDTPFLSKAYGILPHNKAISCNIHIQLGPCPDHVPLWTDAISKESDRPAHQIPSEHNFVLCNIDSLGPPDALS